MDKIDILIEYYGIPELLELNDIDPRSVVERLIEDGEIDLDDYFYDGQDILEAEDYV